MPGPKGPAVTASEQDGRADTTTATGGERPGLDAQVQRASPCDRLLEVTGSATDAIRCPPRAGAGLPSSVPSAREWPALSASPGWRTEWVSDGWSCLRSVRRPARETAP